MFTTISHGCYIYLFVNNSFFAIVALYRNLSILCKLKDNYSKESLVGLPYCETVINK